MAKSLKNRKPGKRRKGAAHPEPLSPEGPGLRTSNERYDVALVWLLELAHWHRNPENAGMLWPAGQANHELRDAAARTLQSVVELRERWARETDISGLVPAEDRPRFPLSPHDLVAHSVRQASRSILQRLGKRPNRSEKGAAREALRRLAAEWGLEIDDVKLDQALNGFELRERVTAFLTGCGFGLPSHDPQYQIARAVEAVEREAGPDYQLPPTDARNSSAYLLALLRTQYVHSIPRALQHVLSIAGYPAEAASRCAVELTAGRRSDISASGLDLPTLDRPGTISDARHVFLRPRGPGPTRPPRVVFTQPLRYPLRTAPVDGIFSLATTPLPSVVACCGEATVGILSIVSRISGELSEPCGIVDVRDREFSEIELEADAMMRRGGAKVVFLVGYPRTPAEVAQLSDLVPYRILGVARFVSPTRGKKGNGLSFELLEEQIIAERVPYAVLPGDDLEIASAWLALFAGVGHEPTMDAPSRASGGGDTGSPPP